MKQFRLEATPTVEIDVEAAFDTEPRAVASGLMAQLAYRYVTRIVAQVVPSS